MKPLHRIIGAASAATKVLVQTSLLSGALIGFVTGIASGEAMEKKGTTPYVTHFVFRPLQTINIEGVGSVTLLEATGTTDNMKGEKMLDKMSARCEALSVDGKLDGKTNGPRSGSEALVTEGNVCLPPSDHSVIEAGLSALVHIDHLHRVTLLGRRAILHDPAQLARLGVGGLPGAGMKLGLRHRGTLILSA